MASNTLPSQNFSTNTSYITPLFRTTSGHSTPPTRLLAHRPIHVNQLRSSRMNTNAATNTLVSSSNLEVDGVNSDADAGFEPEPPAYTYHAADQKGSNSGNRRSIFKLASMFSSCLGRSRSKSSPPSVSDSTPPPYVSQEEIDLMAERVKQLDIFFGGASL